MGNCLGADVAASKYAAGASIDEAGHSNEADSALQLLHGALAYSTPVQLHIHAKDLRKADIFSSSDCMAVLFMRDARGGWQEVGRTEMIANTVSPSFVRKFRVVFNFEKVQEMKLLLLDIDSGQDAATVNPHSCDQLGQVEFKLSEVLTARGKQMVRPVVASSPGKAAAGSAYVSAEEVAAAREQLDIVFGAQGLMNVETFSKSDPFLEIARLQEDSEATGGQRWLPVFKTEVVHNSLNPEWRRVSISAVSLNNGDMLRPLRLRVMDHQGSGQHRLLGECTASASQLQQAAASQGPSQGLPLTLPGKPQRANGSSSGCGQLLVRSFTATSRPTFVDYIQAGLELGFVVGVDFTASNGPPYSPSSLHHLHPDGRYTPYEEAIMGVGHVMEFYDADCQFPVFGFGGAPLGQVTSHCFPLNSDHANPYVHGLQAVQQTYRAALGQYGLSGPTLFAPLINTVAAMAAQPSSPPRYFVLLILTDGAIMDMQDTIAAIVAASRLPLSILIVGVGNDDFSSMEALDSDKRRLATSSGLAASRDIVQFVEFNRFRNSGPALAAELLAELPGQLVQYMRQNNVPLPQAAPGGSMASMAARTSFAPPASAMGTMPPVAHAAASAPPLAVPYGGSSQYI